MTARTAALERRIDALEEALTMQSVLIGRCLSLVDAGDHTSRLNEWLLELTRDQRRQLPLSPITEQLMGALLHGQAIALPPELASLSYSP